MKKIEKLILLILLIISLCMYSYTKFFKSNDINVIVKDQNENELLSFDLNKDAYYELNGKIGKFHIEVKNGRCRAIDVDCPNQICVNTGWISLQNPVPIICLPNGIIITINN